MIPVLFEKDETAFLTKGIGVLADALSCTATEERNGIFEVSMTYPVDGVLYGELRNDRIILAKPNETMQAQPFRIYSITAPLSGVVTVNAEHVSYQLNSIPVFPFTASTCPEAVAGMISNSVTANPFAFSTDKTTAGNFSIQNPANFRSMLYGVQGSLVDVYGGGDYFFDRWTIQLLAHRGQDNGVSIEYGKNLTDLKQELSIASLVTGVAPYWTDGEGDLVVLPEKVITLQNDFSYERVTPIDLSQEFEEKPTVAELRRAAESYLSTTELTTPKVSLTVSFVPLWQTENYKENPLYSQIAGLERVAMGDTVKVRFVKLGVDASARVIKTVYDVLAERYTTVSIGDPTSTSVTRAVANQMAIDQAPTVDFMTQAILNATNAITGATGGYVVLDPPKNPQRILIMDTPDKETAVNVWQWNLNGLGFSSNGINGPYRLAMTTNPGAIVADFITAGTLNANIIKAGVIRDVAGKNSINMATGDVSMQGTFTSAQGMSRSELNGGALKYYYSNLLRLSMSGGDLEYYLENGNVGGKISKDGVMGNIIGLVTPTGGYWPLFEFDSSGFPTTNQGNFRIDGYRVRWDGQGYLRQWT